MGTPLNGGPIKAHRYYQQQAWFQAMMEEQEKLLAEHAYANYMAGLNVLNDPPRPRDIHAAGQVFDGLTGERKQR